LAKRAVALREQNGHFVSTADFSQRLGLQPHFAAQIDNLAFAAPPTVPTPEQPTTPQTSGRRVIDI